ncbi:MAG: gudP [Anaerosporomusa subterranea]|jgi:MFS family permease|nr:gudP [Anaerosporomusa subterranea]
MLWTLALGWAVIYADRTCLYPLLAVIADDLGISSAQAGALTSAYFLFYVAMQIPAGILGDRLGLKPVLIANYGLAGLGILGLGYFGDNYYLLLLFAALHGLGAGAYYPAAYGTVLSQVEQSRRGFSSAVIGTGMALGLIVGLAMSGSVYEWLESYQWPFILMSIPTFAILPVFWRNLPECRGAAAVSWSIYRAILSDSALWRINIATFCALYGFWVAVSWGPTFLKAERGFSLDQAGLFTGMMAITALPAALAWGKFSDRVGRKKIASTVLPLGALSLYLLSFAQGKIAIMGVLLIFGLFSNSAFTPIMVAWTGDIASRRYPGFTGAAVGIFNCVIMISAIAAPLVSGYLRDLSGSLVPAIVAGSIVMAAGTVLLLGIPELHLDMKEADR